MKSHLPLTRFAIEKAIKEGYATGYKDGIKKGISQSAEFFENVGTLFLADKRGWQTESLNQYIKYIVKYAEMYYDGDVTAEEIKQILKEEYGLEVKSID